MSVCLLQPVEAGFVWICPLPPPYILTKGGGIKVKTCNKLVSLAMQLSCYDMNAIIV